jgi:TolA-binding protein
MVYSAFRYLSIGAVSITAVLLLALTVLRDPDAVLTRLGASVASNRPLTGSDAGLIVERDQLRRERSSLERQVADLRSQIAQLTQELEQAQGHAEPIRTDADGTAQTGRLTGGAESDHSERRQARNSAAVSAAALDLASTGTMHERLLLLEERLVQARRQDAELLLESILFQITFRSGAKKDVPETALMIRQALAAVAAADLEKAIFYTEQARSRLGENQ